MDELDVRQNNLSLIIVSLKLMKSSILALSCLLVLPLLAQNAPGLVNPRIPRRVSEQAAESQALKKNITIRLHGTTTTGAEIDLSLSGIGPSFTANQVVNDDTMLTFEYMVSETGAGYEVSYTVGAQIDDPTLPQQNTPIFKYRNIIIRGTVLCSEKKAQVLVQNGTKSLKLTVTEDAEQDAPSNR